MYIRYQDNEHLLIRLVDGPDGKPREVVLVGLGQDPELNLFLAAEIGRRKHPELWEGVEDYHLLQALETFKRRSAGFKPALVSIRGKGPKRERESEEDHDLND